MELEDLIRIGKVSSVENKAQRLVRVTYPGYSDQVSGPLKVLSVSAATSDQWIPGPGQTVLCLLLPNGDGDGVILGSL
jgi:hypothetical protein